MSVIQLVKNDTAPRIYFTLKQDGTPIDLTDATIKFIFRKQGAATNLFSRDCVVEDVAGGVCYYDWQSGDLVNTGAHRGEVEITFADGKVQTCKDLLRFDVRDEL